MMKNIAICGAGGLGREVACLISRVNASKPAEAWNIVGFYDDAVPAGATISHYGRVLGRIDALNSITEPLDVVIAVGSPAAIRSIRERIVNDLVSFPNVIDPSFDNVDPQEFTIGEGNIVMQRCMASCGAKIGSFNLFNGDNVVGHDDVIGNYNVIMPNVHLSGNVLVGNGNMLGVGSIVLQGVKVGNDVTIGAGSVLMTKPKDGNTYIGVPAKRFAF